MYAVLAAGIIALGWSAILIRLADAPPLAIAAYRMLGGAALLLPFTAKNLPALWGSLSAHQRALWVLSGLLLAFHFSLWIESLRHTSVASSVVLVTTNPIFAGVGAWLLLGEREGRTFWAGVAVTTFGGALLGWSDARSWGGSGLGNMLALGGAVMASGYLLCGRSLRRYLPLGPYVTVCYGLSGTILVVGASVSGQPLSGFSWSTWILLGLMAVGPTLIGHTAVNYALGYLPSGRVALAIVGEPVVASVLAWWILDEPLTGIRAIAAIFILMGIIWGSQRPIR